MKLRGLLDKSQSDQSNSVTPLDSIVGHLFFSWSIIFYSSTRIVIFVGMNGRGYQSRNVLQRVALTIGVPEKMF